MILLHVPQFSYLSRPGPCPGGPAVFQFFQLRKEAGILARDERSMRDWPGQAGAARHVRMWLCQLESASRSPKQSAYLYLKAIKLLCECDKSHIPTTSCTQRGRAKLQPSRPQPPHSGTLTYTRLAPPPGPWAGSRAGSLVWDPAGRCRPARAWPAAACRGLGLGRPLNASC